MTSIPSHLRWYLSIKRREVVNESLEIYYSRLVGTPTFGGEWKSLVSDLRIRPCLSIPARLLSNLGCAKNNGGLT